MPRTIVYPHKVNRLKGGVEEIKTEATALIPKQGLQTTEFWVALVPILVGVLAVFGVHIDTDTATTVAIAGGGAVAAVYAASRTILKVFRLKALPELQIAANEAAKNQAARDYKVQPIKAVPITAKKIEQPKLEGKLVDGE